MAETVILGPQLSINTDVIKAAQALQEHLAQAPREQQPQLAAEGIETILNDPRELYGSRKVAVHSLAAFVLKDYYRTCSIDEELYDGASFGDVRLTGHFSRFAFVINPVVTSLTLSLFNVEVLRSDNPEYQGETITSGLHVPVMAIEQVMPLAS